jgi:gliding motility-associated-like protein
METHQISGYSIREKAFLTLCFWSILMLLTSNSFTGQIMISDGGTITTCGDIFYDDAVGADGDGGPYTDNDYVLTLCPDVPGTAVSVNFLGFDVQTNANPNNNDVLYVFDGETTGAPMVGAGSGNLFEDMTITASINNPTGCLTFQFVCNNGATGGDIGWAADVSCVTPCTYPASAFSLTDPAPFDDFNLSVGVCPFQDVTFDGSASSADGVPLANWIWNWGDGSVETTSTPVVSHNFEEPGEYLVSLVVEDENQCNSVNLEPYQVLVSTIPVFNVDFSSPLCTGSPGFLDGNPVQSITWTALPPLAVSESEPLPDATGIPFTSELFIDFFDTDQVLEDCDDLMSFSAVIEHSFIGDLTMWITCPDGTEVLIMENGASGAVDPTGCNNPDLGGNDLGEPVFGDGGGTPEPGIGYEYTWSTEGEFILDDPDNPNLDGFNAVPAGLYGTCGDICDLVGCPLNGIWEFNILDQWAADNGFLFEWGIDFNPEIVPGVTTFTPTIGADMDSSFWQVTSSSPGVENIDGPADLVDLMFEEEGIYPFTYTVTNNFSCSWDTIVNVEVIPGLGNSVTAGSDFVFCQDAVQLEGAFVGGGVSPCANDEGTVNYCYGNNANDAFTYCPDNPGDGTMMTIDFSAGTVEPFWDFVSIYDGDSNAAPLIATAEGDLSELTYTATNAGGCLTIVYVSDGANSCESGAEEESVWCASCGGQVECGYLWSWDPPTYLDNPLSPTPTVLDFDGLAIEYTLLVEPIGLPYCGTEDFVTVFPGFQYEVQSSNPTCLITDGSITATISEPSSEGPWTLVLSEGGTLIETIESNGGVDVFSGLDEGDYILELSDTEGCLYSQNVELSAPVPMDFDLTVNPIICINGSVNLEVSSEMDPENSWTYTWDSGLGLGFNQVVSPTIDTDYEVFATATNGCTSAPQVVTVQVYDSLSMEIAGPDLICGGSFAELEADVFEGGSGSGYDFNWTWQSIPVGTNDSEIVDYPAATGSYCLTLTDDCETPAITECIEVVIETPIAADFTSDTTRACIPGIFQFESLVDLSLISQHEWIFGDGELSFEENPVHVYPNPGGYDITYNITSLIGCEYTRSEPGYLQVYTRPAVGFTATPQPTRVPDTKIEFESVNSNNVVDWYWLFDSIQNLGVSPLSDPDFVFPIDMGGDYPVTLVVTDENGCSNQITRIVEILDLFALYIPTSFTPNNDGVNDSFFVQGTDIDPDRFKMEVFNRWGNKVFQTNDLNEPWFGPAAPGSEFYAQDAVYYYRVIVYALSSTAERQEVTGSVMVMR